jgi:hypothetical protein
MYFATVGSTSFMTPNTLNLSKDFALQNGNIDPEKQNMDDHRFNWFLINANCPPYLKGTYNEMRYFNRGLSDMYIDLNKDKYYDTSRWELPKMTSRVIVCNTSFAETVFLGVKYRLPSRFDGYQFAVYANFDDEKYIDLEYHVEVNELQKTIYLSINRYLDFSDLLRGGRNAITPLIDLSYFYFVRNGFNEYSEFLYTYHTAGIILAKDFTEAEKNTIQFDSVYPHDWKYKDPAGKEWICIRRDPASIVNFTDIFPAEGTEYAYAYVYKNIDYEGRTYTILTTTFKFVNIRYLREDYMWVDDLIVKFFDTKDIFLQYYDIELQKDVLLKSTTEDVVTLWGVKELRDENGLPYPFPMTEIGEVILNKSEKVDNEFPKKMMRLLLPTEMVESDYGTDPAIKHRIVPLSFKQSYFRITYYLRTGYDIDPSEPPAGDINVFTFSNFALPMWGYAPENSIVPSARQIPVYTRDQILQEFGLNEGQLKGYATSGYATGKNSHFIDLFDRNQVWSAIRGLFLSDLKIKYMSDDLVRSVLDDFTLPRLIDYTNMYPLSMINDSLDFRKQPSNHYVNITVFPEDKNLVIWNNFMEPKIYLIQRTKSAYFPLFKEVDLHEFQLNIYQNPTNPYQIFSMWDNRFGNVVLDSNHPTLPDILATGLWEEVTAPVSTLFIKNHDISMSVSVKVNGSVNVYDLLGSSFDDIETSTGDNTTYIQSIDKNVDDWIVDKYTSFLINNYYKLDSIYLLYPEAVVMAKEATSNALILNEYVPQRIDYEIDTKDVNIIYPKLREDSVLKIVYKRR